MKIRRAQIGGIGRQMQTRHAKGCRIDFPGGVNAPLEVLDPACVHIVSDDGNPGAAESHRHRKTDIAKPDH
jgi:hypothetical protein